MPLLIVGCGDSENKGGTGGTIGGTGGTLRYDGGGGAGGAKLDVGGAPDVTPPAVDTALTADVLVAVDATPVIDVAVAVDTTPVVLDAAIPDAPIQIDMATIDATKPIDTAAVDTIVAIDSAPVCTMTKAFTGGYLTADLTLTAACSPYTIKDDIRVDGNATLTIEAGATLRFQPDTKIWIGYSTAAKIAAVGTATSPIIFTSAVTTPGAGDWAGIVFWSNTMNGSKLAYAKFDYCGSNGDACILGEGAKANRVSIDHVTIAHVGSGSDGIYQKDVDSNFAISNCTFNDISSTPTQQYAISVYAQSFAGIDTTNTYAGNAMIQLMGGTISANTTWKNLGTTISVTDNIRIEGASTPALTIATGGTFKFATNTNVWIGYSGSGSLIVNGTATSGVTFTSLNTTPGPGDWLGIVVWKGNASFRYTTITYAGSDNGAVSVVDDTATLDVQNCTLSYSASYGIGIPCGSTATVTNTGNTFANNATGNVGPGPARGTTACP
jgi:hypothetical protein